MEGSTHSDRPLLPQHQDGSPTRRPLSQFTDGGDLPASPASIRQSRVNIVAPGDPHQQETDIADLGPQQQGLDEKVDDRIRSRRNTAEVKAASVEDEAQALDWIVPVQNGLPPEKRRTVGERLDSTLRVARVEQLKYEKRAKYASWAINGAMFAQIVSNALVTGLSASTGNRHAQIGVSALGALGTILASFLVRVRGTREPERSVSHSQNLEKFIRELEAFIMDEGLSRDRKWDAEVKRFRVEFDKLQTAVHQSENGQPMSDSTSQPAP